MASSIDTKNEAHNRGPWKLSKWAKKRTNIPQGPPHFPEMRKSKVEPPTGDNLRKVAILSERIFPKIFEDT